MVSVHLTLTAFTRSSSGVKFPAKAASPTIAVRVCNLLIEDDPRTSVFEDVRALVIRNDPSDQIRAGRLLLDSVRRLSYVTKLGQG